MPRVETGIHFSAPQDAVWAHITDLERAEERIQGIKKLELLTDGPIGKGSRFRETRVMFGKEATEEMEITGWNPPNSYTIEAESHGCHYTSVISLEPEGDGTRVSISFEGQPLTFGAKVMSGLMGWMMKGACRKAFEADFNDLKKSLEQNQGAAQPA